MQSKKIAQAFSGTGCMAGYTDRQAVLDFVSGEVYRNPHHFGFDSEDDAADALLRYRNRMDLLVDRYIQHGHPYERYFETGLYYMARSIRREKKKDAEKEFVCESPEVWGCGGSVPAISCAPPGVLPFATASAENKKSTSEILAEAGTNGRRLVYLYLKCALETNDTSAEKAAQRSGVPSWWLAEMAERIRFRLDGERLRLCGMTEIRNAAWSKMYNLRIRLSRENDPLKHQALSNLLDRQKKRYDIVQARILHSTARVPNSVISSITGVPKGTIDSGLHYLKKHQSLFIDGKNG